MKKLVFAIIASTIAMATFGWNGVESNILTSARNFVAGYATNQVYRMGSYASTVCEGNADLALAMDEILAGTPPVNMITAKFAIPFPKTHAAALADLRREYPAYVSETDLVYSYGSPEEYLGFELMMLDRRGGSSFYHQRVTQHAMQAAGRNLRRHLRAQGKKIIVGPDGKDPCKPYIDAVSAALNAPLYEGLSNALSNCGVDIPVPVRYRTALDDATLAFETNAVFMGDVKFNENRQWAIRFALGLEEYNRFVERYNGGSN